jgi:hypothetical protein
MAQRLRPHAVEIMDALLTNTSPSKRTLKIDLRTGG